MQTFTAPLNTTYKIECWGAQGGEHAYWGYGPGAYTYGLIYFPASQLIYIYVGQKGDWSQPNFDQVTNGTFNGGGGFLIPESDKNNGRGGGATDIRLKNGDWDSFNSLRSRIMVAAGGGCNFSLPTPYGGTLSSLGEAENHFPDRHYTTISQGASQTSGYKFGIGQDGGRAGAGGGYYGGCATVKDENNKIGLRGAGGSSFISGYTGCDAIGESSTEDNIIHTGQPNHYSGKVFTNPVMIAGNATMPKPNGGTETGHSGDGYCIISWISPSL